MKYIGSRSCDNDPINDIGILYFSSSKNKNFIKKQKENIKNYDYKILSTHSNRKEAIEEEIRLHKLYDVENNTLFYNMKNQSDSKFDSSGYVNVYDENKNIVFINTNNPKYLSGDFVHINKNKVAVQDKDGNKFHAYKNDPKYISGEYVPIRKGSFYVNNGIKNKLIPEGESIPSGFVKGFLKKKQNT